MPDPSIPTELVSGPQQEAPETAVRPAGARAPDMSGKMTSGRAASVQPRDDEADAPGWRGTARYDVVRSLGRGGMGAVYEAFDRDRRQRVAVKTLLHFGPASLYRFKQEFRALADVVHPNLVRLHELVATGDDKVFFSMELVLGKDFIAYVLRDDLRLGAPGLDGAIRPGAAPAGEIAPARGRTHADIGRLVPALRQLALGVHALHVAGKIHRDIKPSNVLVTDGGRVVLLDFGVAMDLEGQRGAPEVEDGIVGTPQYMAPEQADDAVVTPACDWYSVGVMLYEALVGRPPFTGRLFDVLEMKLTRDPPPPRECVEGIPEALDALCVALLSREPQKRPRGAEVLRRLDWRGVDETVASSRPPGLAGEAPLLGRGPQLAALEDAFEATRAGRAVAVRVRGQSGAGKSVLVQELLRRLSERDEAVVLRGRAYERESVPYKAVDGIIDALSRYLMQLSDRDHDPLTLPPDVWTLARVFPVLRRIPEIGDVGEQPPGDPQRLRRRAFLALRELLGSLARRRPLVVCVDDVQWGDPDSAALLVELLRPPHAPPLLLLLVQQDEAAGRSSFLRELEARWPEGAETRDLLVGALTLEEARGLALRFLGSEGDGTQAMADAIARESGGSPFLVEELARQDRRGVATFTLESVVGERLARLPEDARRLLEIIAVAGRPLAMTTAGDAAGAYAGVDEQIELLRERRFVRKGFRDGRETVETCHNRIREAIVRGLSPETTRSHHARLGGVLESTTGADLEAIAVHLLGAGQSERAGEYAERAAEQAVSKLAFDQAARLLRLRLDTMTAPVEAARPLRLRLAEVLEWSGHAAEAARAYLAAAEGAPPMVHAILQRAAAEQLLASGQLDEGTETLRRVLAALGMDPPRTALGALVHALAARLWLVLRGYRFRERDAEAVTPDQRMRIDALYAGAMQFGIVDAVLALGVQATHARFALRSGDRFQVLRALSLEAAHFGLMGGPPTRRERSLMAMAERLAARLGTPEGRGLVHGIRGVGCFLRGQWKEAQRELEVALRTMAPQPKRAGWQTNANLFSTYLLFYTGELGELRRREARLLAEAEQRGDLYTQVNLRVITSAILRLVEDDPDAARRTVNSAMARWSHRSFLVQHWQAMRVDMEIELYTGRGDAAEARFARDARPLARSGMMRAQFVRVLTAYSRGRAAIAAIAQAPGRRAAQVAAARGHARRLEREGAPYAAAFGAIVRACAANASGDHAEATRALRVAVAACEVADMPLHATVARRRLGVLLGGAEGEALVSGADDAMVAEGVRAPERFAWLLAPGAWAAVPDVSATRPR